MTAKQAINADCKEYEERGQAFTVAQIEELSFALFEEKKDELLRELEARVRKTSMPFAHCS